MLKDFDNLAKLYETRRHCQIAGVTMTENPYDFQDKAALSSHCAIRQTKLSRSLKRLLRLPRRRESSRALRPRTESPRVGRRDPKQYSTGITENTRITNAPACSTGNLQLAGVLAGQWTSTARRGTSWCNSTYSNAKRINATCFRCSSRTRGSDSDRKYRRPHRMSLNQQAGAIRRP